MSLRSPYTLHKLANKLYVRGVPVIPKVITLFIRFFYGCYMSPSASLGEGCSLGYGGLGVVIGGSSKLGFDVEVGANVLIGGNAREEGFPIVGNNVYIGTGAKVLGPIEVGENVVIAANSVVLRSVPANSVVAGMPAKIVKDNIDISSFLFHRG